MKQKFVKIIGLAGGVLTVIGIFLLLLLDPELMDRYGLILVGVGVAFILISIALRPGVLKDIFKSRSVKYGTNLGILIMLVFGLIIMANYISAKHSKRFDLTESKIFSLSEQTINILNTLPREIKVKAFFKEDETKTKTEDLLKEYIYQSKKISYEFIDPDRHPADVNKYGIKTYGTMVIESGGHETKINTATESTITNAVLKVTRDKQKIVYFLEGHGEHSIDDQDNSGFSIVKKDIEGQNYIVKKLNLVGANRAPDDCSVLISASNTKPLFENEEKAIKDYLNKAGRWIVLLDAYSNPGMDKFLDDWGVIVGRDVIVDKIAKLLISGDYFSPLGNYEPHEITKGFNFTTFYPLARSVVPKRLSGEGLIVNSIVKSSSNSWADTVDITNKMNEQVEISYDPKEDKIGPVSLAVVITKDIKDQTKVGTQLKKEKEIEETVAKEDKATKQAKIAVFGDSDFVTNQYFALQGNGDLFIRTLNWLAEESELIAIRPKKGKYEPLTLTPLQGRIIFYLSVIILPLIIMVTGIKIWSHRRSL
ncbi:MAG: Gldg family protein [bacterium]